MLIGINGQLGSGKDAFFERVRELTRNTWSVELPGRPERRAFADKLKQSTAALFGITLEFLERAKRDETTLVQIRELRFGISRVRGLRWTRHIPGFERIVVSQTMRVTLQRQGTEAGRDVFGKSFWVDQCLPPDLDHTDKVILVTDARFPNEIERIRKLGGTMVRVNGPVADNGDDHPSEQRTADDLIHVEVDNTIRDDGFANLDRQVRDILTHVSTIGEALEERRVVQRAPRHVSAEVEVQSGE